jgi:transposase
MPNRVRILTVPDADRAELERRVRDRGVQARVAERARIVLLSADGLTGPQIAQRVGCTEPTVVKWRRQFAEDGLAGLEDAPRPGGPKSVLTEGAIAEILSATVTPQPRALADQGVTHWSSRRLAAPEQAAPGQPRLDHPAVAAVLPAAAPHRRVQVLHRPAAGRQGRRRGGPVPEPASASTRSRSARR